MQRFFGRRLLVLSGAVAVVAASALALFGLGARGALPRTGTLVVRAGLLQTPGRFVRGEALYDGRGGQAALGGAVSGALMGPLSPVAVGSPDGRYVAYNTWRELRPIDNELSFAKQGISTGDALGTPSLRVHDEAGHDFLLQRGAYSLAWRGDGALAYVQGLEADFRANEPYAGQLVVRPGLHGRAAAWTTESGRYVVYAWAGSHLLFYRLGEGETLQLLVADGPGRIRALCDGSAIALSPDGTRVAVLGSDAQNIRILDVASGRELAWLDLATATPQLAWLGYSGSWSGDQIVAAASAGLAVFHVGPGSLGLEQVLALDPAQFPAGVQEPHFADQSGNQIVASADVPPQGSTPGSSFLLACDRIARTCERGEPAPAREWLRLVDNPSRPAGGGRR
ncbi:MAG TPA: hypothetical protein VF002_03615 [Gaiellaceae bacterium]